MKRKYIQISLGQLSGNWTQKYQVAIQIGTSTVGEGLFIANLFPSFEQGVIIQPMQKKDGPCAGFGNGNESCTMQQVPTKRLDL